MSGFFAWSPPSPLDAVFRHDGNARPGGKPLVVGLEFQPQIVVTDSQVAIATTYHGIGHDRLHLLCHHTDVRRVAAVIGEAVEAQAVVQRAEQCNILLQADVGASAAGPSATDAPSANRTGAEATGRSAAKATTRGA